MTIHPRISKLKSLLLYRLPANVSNQSRRRTTPPPSEPLPKASRRILLTHPLPRIVIRDNVSGSTYNDRAKIDRIRPLQSPIQPSSDTGPRLKSVARTASVRPLSVPVVTDRSLVARADPPNGHMRLRSKNLPPLNTSAAHRATLSPNLLQRPRDMLSKPSKIADNRPQAQFNRVIRSERAETAGSSFIQMPPPPQYPAPTAAPAIGTTHSHRPRPLFAPIGERQNDHFIGSMAGPMREAESVEPTPTTTVGSLYLDGHQLGTWVTRHLEELLNQAPSGTSAVDTRALSPWSTISSTL